MECPGGVAESWIQKRAELPEAKNTRYNVNVGILCCAERVPKCVGFVDNNNTIHAENVPAVYKLTTQKKVSDVNTVPTT